MHHHDCDLIWERAVARARLESPERIEATRLIMRRQHHHLAYTRLWGAK